ncbi:copper resistance CopC/CopD family protein [Ureibacillus acetophenoni]|uniref:Copper transport protein n=1 Tax=Ureibacillus acetophenoni TaxID=614649 RepID=A0A285UA97_9BACL|nr:copper resistance protein CopC [Ureibacillus acetophenoni]SOC37486.1 copper transport protein [Ureibacillus acetophenoni]
MEQSPQPNSHNETAPSEVILKFNSEVEENFTIKVYDENYQEVGSHSPQITDDNKEISVQLPSLADGIYKIEYYFISSNDGHALQGDFFILVGTDTDSYVSAEGNAFGSSNSNNELSNMNVLEIIIFALKAMYYIGFVLLIGWIIWWQTVQHYSNDLRRKFVLWGLVFQMLHLVGLISMILIQVDIFTSKGLFFTPNFPFDTNFGSFWLVSLVLSLIGFLCLFKNRWIDILWITILVLCKSLNGHASTFDFTLITVPFNSLHLIAAAIWAGGLAFIVLFWKKQKLYVMSFLPTFSTYALISFILMAVSGSIVTLIYSPDFFLLSNDWSRILLVKILVVAIVILFAAFIRKKIKDSNQSLGKWLVLDFSLMIIILIIVSILTYLSPTP